MTVFSFGGSIVFHYLLLDAVIAVFLLDQNLCAMIVL